LLDISRNLIGAASKLGSDRTLVLIWAFLLTYPLTLERVDGRIIVPDSSRLVISGVSEVIVVELDGFAVVVVGLVRLMVVEVIMRVVDNTVVRIVVVSLPTISTTCTLTDDTNRAANGTGTGKYAKYALSIAMLSA
jgi:hypothetical protein